MRIIGGTRIIPAVTGQLSRAFGVQSLRPDGTPAPGIHVMFEFPSGGGEFTNGRPAMTVVTDVHGEAWAYARAFNDGAHQIEARAAARPTVTFTLDANPTVAQTVHVAHGGTGHWARPVASMVIVALIVGGLLTWTLHRPQATATADPKVIRVEVPTPSDPTTAHDAVAWEAIGRIETDVATFRADTEDALTHKPDRHEVEADARERFRHLHRETYGHLAGLAAVARVSERDRPTYIALCRRFPDIPACRGE